MLLEFRLQGFSETGLRAILDPGIHATTATNTTNPCKP